MNEVQHFSPCISNNAHDSQRDKQNPWWSDLQIHTENNKMKVVWNHQLPLYIPILKTKENDSNFQEKE